MSTQQEQIETQARTNPVRFLRKRGWQQAGSWWKKPGEPGFTSMGKAIRDELGQASGGSADESGGSLPFPPLVISSLAAAGITSLADLEGKTDEELLAIKGVAKKVLATIRELVPAPDAEVAGGTEETEAEDPPA